MAVGLIPTMKATHMTPFNVFEQNDRQSFDRQVEIGRWGAEKATREF